jgi:hypothetical protein
MYPVQSVKVGVFLVSNIKTPFFIRIEIHNVDIVNPGCCDADETGNGGLYIK